VRDLVGQHRRELLLGSQDVEQARVDDDLASWRGGREETEKEEREKERREKREERRGERRRRERKKEEEQVKKTEKTPRFPLPFSLPSLPGATIALTLPGSSTTMNSCSKERERKSE